MWENQDKFPANYECPPKKSFNYSGLLYKVSTSMSENDQYLRNTLSDRKIIKKPEKMCRACGHSVFLREADIVESIEKNGGVSKGVFKKWKYINAFKPSKNSKILPTHSQNTYNHHTYWHHGEYSMIFGNMKKI